LSSGNQEKLFIFHFVEITMTGEYIAKVPLPTNMMAVELGHA
jgi:hypothetical protein